MEGTGCPTFVCALSELVIVGCFYIDLLVCEEAVQISYYERCTKSKISCVNAESATGHAVNIRRQYLR